MVVFYMANAFPLRWTAIPHYPRFLLLEAAATERTSMTLGQQTELADWNRSALTPGICSVTLRQCGIGEVMGAVAEAGLAGIEWGTDVHIRDEASADEAREATAASGLEVLSLGSYYRVGSFADFAALADLAVRLGAPRIRVWAGEQVASGEHERNRLALHGSGIGVTLARDSAEQVGRKTRGKDS